MYLHVNTKPLKKTLWCLQSKLFWVCDHIPNIIWKPTIRIGYVSRPFKYSNFSMFIQSAYSCCGCSSTGYTAYDHNLHLIFLPFLYKQQCHRYSLLSGICPSWVSHPKPVKQSFHSSPPSKFPDLMFQSQVQSWSYSYAMQFSPYFGIKKAPYPSPL